MWYYWNFGKDSSQLLAGIANQMDPDTQQYLATRLQSHGISTHQFHRGELDGWDLSIARQCILEAKIYQEFGLTLSEFMAEKFGRGLIREDFHERNPDGSYSVVATREELDSDWERQLKKPRGSVSAYTVRDKQAVRLNKERATAIMENRERIKNGLEPLKVPGFNIVDRQNSAGSAPMLSILPTGKYKDPCSVKLEDGSIISVHKPGLNGIGCERNKSQNYGVPLLQRNPNKVLLDASSDVTGGGMLNRREFAIVGFDQFPKSSRCNGVGHVEISVDGQTEYHSVVDWDRQFSEYLASKQLELTAQYREMGYFDIIEDLESQLQNASSYIRDKLAAELKMEKRALEVAIQTMMAESITAILPESPLFRYYSQQFPTQNAFQLCLKAYSGGTLKMKYVKDLDFIKISERGMQFTQDAVDDQIRQLAGLVDEKVNSRQKSLWRKRAELIDQLDQLESMATKRENLRNNITAKLAELDAGSVDARMLRERMKQLQDPRQQIVVKQSHTAGGETRISRTMLKESILAEIAAIEESVGHLFPPISDVLRLTWTKAAIKKLTRLSTLNMSEDALRSRLEKICKLSKHTGRLRSKQTKMRTGDKSCKVNGVRVNQLADLFVKVRLTFGLAEPGQDLTEFKSSFGQMGFTQPELDRAFRVFGQNLYVGLTVNRAQLESVLNHPLVGFNWTEYALARIADGSYQPSWTADSKRESIHTGLRRSENRERLAELMMTRLSALSIQQFLDGGGNSWVQMSDGNGRYYNPNMVIVEFQHVKLDSKEYERVVEAWKIVRDAGENPAEATVELDEVNIVSAMKRPSAWKMLTEIREEFVVSQYRA